MTVTASASEINYHTDPCLARSSRRRCYTTNSEFAKNIGAP